MFDVKNKMLKTINKKVVPSTAFERLIKDFMSDEFEISERSLYTFLNTLHSLDTELKFAHLYTVQPINDIIVGGFVNFQEKVVGISVNAILHLDKNASKETIERYKLAILAAYFHETRHEKQMEECFRYLNYMPNSDTAFAKVFTEENFGKDGSNYDVINSLCEIDARVAVLKKLYALEKRGILHIKPQCCQSIMMTISQLLAGLNGLTEDNEVLKYQDDPFSYKQVLKRITNYGTMQLDDRFENFKTAEFIEQFKKEYNEKILSVMQNEYVFFMKRMFINTEISKSTKMNMTYRYRINYFEEENWNNLIKLMCQKPNPIIIEILFGEKELMLKDKNDILLTEIDLEQFFMLKGIEYNRKNLNEFYDDPEIRKEFEDWIRKKQELEREREHVLEKQFTKEKEDK